MLTRWFLSCEQTAISWHHFALPHLKSMQPPAVFVSARSRQTMITILQGVFQILQVSKPCQVAIGTKRRLMWIGTVFTRHIHGVNDVERGRNLTAVEVTGVSWTGWSLELPCIQPQFETGCALHFTWWSISRPHGFCHFYFVTGPIWRSLFKDRSILGIVTIVETENKEIWVCLKIVSP